MLILYSGSDAYRLRHATTALVAEYHATYGSVLNLFTVDGDDDDAAEQLERPLKYPSFFEEKKLIVVSNAAGAAMAGILKQYKLHELDDIVLAAVQHTKNESCDKKVLTALAKAANKTEAFEPLTGVALASWVRDYCTDRNATIETAALTALLQRTNSDMQSLSNELGKLCAYAGNGVIALQAVQLLTPTRYEQDGWELSNALAAHDKRSVIAVLWRRLQDGVSEQLLLASLAAGIRNLSLVKDMQARHQPNGVIASATGLHPFVISKTTRGAAAADADKLRHAHLGLARLDRSSKDGLADTADGLFSILLGL
ncbi:MAG: DNA polymerase III subunit delta [Patescibacteria group bacterium]